MTICNSCVLYGLTVNARVPGRYASFSSPAPAVGCNSNSTIPSLGAAASPRMIERSSMKPV